MKRIPHTVPQVNRRRGGIAPAPAGSAAPTNPRRWAIAVAVAAVALLARASCGGPFSSGRNSCTESVIADREMHIEALLDVFSRYESKLKAIPGVHGVEIGDERINFVAIDHLVIIVVVDEADVDDRIPQTIEGCGVDQQVLRVKLVEGSD
jgi:hypothetical protein